MALATLDLLARVETRRAAAFGGLDGLAVDDAGSRARLAPGALARHRDEMEVDRFQQPRVAPGVEVALNRRGRREIPRQLCPLAAGRGHVEDRVRHLSQVRRARPSDPVRRRHEGRNQRPLLVRQVACVAQRATLILGASDFSPGHLILRDLRKSQRITSRWNHSPSFWVSL